MNGGVSLDPALPMAVLAIAAVVALALLAVFAVRGRRGLGWRAAALGLIFLTLLNPRTVSERREARPDLVVAIVDETESQRLAGRTERTAAALAALEARLADEPNLELRRVRVASGTEGTQLVKALARARALLPQGRFAGAVLITDGQIHDHMAGSVDMDGPVHVLLTGAPDERDRRVEIVNAPAYAITGKPVTIGYAVHDRGAPDRRAVPVHVRVNGQPVADADSAVPPGARRTLTVTPDRAGLLTVEIAAEAADGEVSRANNRAVATINAVRDRLRVLLISGQPHPGERTWRNLLKADPSVDLVHFTILRPPEKDDFTPLNELALIVFPIQELFERRLKEFDLVVFDRYVVRDILPPQYLDNIRTYVRGGGAMLIAAGPELAGARSLSRTSLKDVLPVVPTGRVMEEGFRPALTRSGRRHPVTADLGGATDWGRWFRVVETDLAPGDGHAPRVVLDGPGGVPVLVLDRTGKGRVAVLASDHVWLWARGYDGGGPHHELLRRLAHWLMKEPALEEEALTAAVRGDDLTVSHRTLGKAEGAVAITLPSGETRMVDLTAAADGRAAATVSALEPGLYTVRMGNLVAMAAKGVANPLEARDLRATDRLLAPLAKGSGGGVFWLGKTVRSLPDIRRVRPGRDAAGHYASGGGWMGLRRNDAHAVIGQTDTPLLPTGLLLALAGLALVGGWWREGK